MSGKLGNAIYGVNGSESHFTPKTLRDRGRYEKGTHDIKNVTKFAFGTTILLRGIGTRMMGRVPLESKMERKDLSWYSWALSDRKTLIVREN